MRYIKAYEMVPKIENDTNKLQVNDYAIIKLTHTDYLIKCDNQIENKIHKITYVSSLACEIDGKWLIRLHEILIFSKSKEDLEIILSQKKYNL